MPAEHFRIEADLVPMFSTCHIFFKYKGLKKLYETGSGQGVQPGYVSRLRLILARLDAGQSPQDLGLPGLYLHSRHFIPVSKRLIESLLWMG
jgi:hypothetical protein